MKNVFFRNRKGEVAVMLILIIVVLTTLTTAAVSLAISTMRDTTTLTLGEKSLTVAESGAENAILRLLRDPGYAGEPSALSIGPGSATITVTGNSPYTIVSTGVVGSMTRTVQVEANIILGKLTVVSWREL